MDQRAEFRPPRLSSPLARGRGGVLERGGCPPSQASGGGGLGGPGATVPNHRHALLGLSCPVVLRSQACALGTSCVCQWHGARASHWPIYFVQEQEVSLQTALGSAVSQLPQLQPAPHPAVSSAPPAPVKHRGTPGERRREIHAMTSRVSTPTADESLCVVKHSKENLPGLPSWEKPAGETSARLRPSFAKCGTYSHRSANEGREVLPSDTGAASAHNSALILAKVSNCVVKYPLEILCEKWRGLDSGADPTATGVPVSKVCLLHSG